MSWSIALREADAFADAHLSIASFEWRYKSSARLAFEVSGFLVKSS